MNDIAVIAPFLDFDDDPLRLEGFLKFKEGLEKQGVALYVIEILAEGDSSKIRKFCKDNYFSETVYVPTWVRENAINVLSSKVSPKYTKLVWMDCDMLIREDDWANKVSKLLDSHKLVKIGESTSWGGMAAHRTFFESVGLFDLDFCGMGDYVSYLSATKENLLESEEEFLSLYKNTNLEIYFKILSYRLKAFEYFQGDYKVLNVSVEKFLSNQNILLPDSMEKRKVKALLLNHVNLRENIAYRGLHEIVKIKNIETFRYSRMFMNYLKSGKVEENKIPNSLDSSPPPSPEEPSTERTKAAIIRELKDLKLAQFEIIQKETQLLKVLENQN
jgi:hypothetical protein